MSLHHLPTMRMVSGSTFARIISVDLLDQSEIPLMSTLVNPVDKPTAQTMEYIAYVILSLQIWCHLLAVRMMEMDVLTVLLWCLRYATLQHISATVTPWGWPVFPFPINRPLNPVL